MTGHRKSRLATSLAPKQSDWTQGRLLSMRLALASQHGDRSAFAVAPPKDEKQRQRDQLASDVDAFLAAGGQVQSLAPGESAQSIRDGEAERARRIQQQMRAYPRKS